MRDTAVNLPVELSVFPGNVAPLGRTGVDYARQGIVLNHQRSCGCIARKEGLPCDAGEVAGAELAPAPHCF